MGNDCRKDRKIFGFLSFLLSFYALLSSLGYELALKSTLKAHKCLKSSWRLSCRSCLFIPAAVYRTCMAYDLHTWETAQLLVPNINFCFFEASFVL